MDKKEYSNYKLGEFIGKSEATIRKIKKEDSAQYEEIVQKYTEQIKALEENAKKKIVAVMSAKGGAGKSTIANIIAQETKDSVILNIDFTSKASEFNSATTINYSDFITEEEEHTLKEVLDAAIDEYGCVFLDTPGDISEEFMEIIELVDCFIIPFNPGERSTSVSLETFKAVFTNGFVTGKHKVSIILNEYLNDEEGEEELKEIIAQIEAVELPDDIELDISYSSLKSTRVIKTMEKHGGQSIDDLSAKNKVAYKAAKKRFTALSNDILAHFELERA